MNDEKLTVIEETLRDVLATLAAARTGAIAREHGWPLPNEGQGQEISRLIVRAFDATVRGMRDPRAMVPGHDEIEQVVTGIALGVLEKVMGLPTPSVVH